MGRGGEAVRACAEARARALKAPQWGRSMAARSLVGERMTGEGPHGGAMDSDEEEAVARGEKSERKSSQPGEWGEMT